MGTELTTTTSGGGPVGVSRRAGPGWVEHVISGLYAWIGDYLARTGNGLHQPMGFYRENRPVPPEELAPASAGRVCVLVHGMGANESQWRLSDRHGGGDYGRLLERRCGYMPLYVRYNPGVHISESGRALDALLERLHVAHGDGLDEILLIGHSVGGLVIRSACHVGDTDGSGWVERVRRVVYLGSPHLGAPLEKATNVATHILGRVDTTVTRVVRDLLDTRSAGVKDLRFGNLVDEDWRDHDPNELLYNRRVPVPWLATARHHRVVGHAWARAAHLGDVMVRPDSAAGRPWGAHPGAPGDSDVQVMPGLSHLALAHHPAVYEHIERWVREDG